MVRWKTVIEIEKRNSGGDLNVLRRTDTPAPPRPLSIARRLSAGTGLLTIVNYILVHSLKRGTQPIETPRIKLNKES